MVYGAALERRFVGNCIEGSNPSPSARREEASPSGLVVSLLEKDLNPRVRRSAVKREKHRRYFSSKQAEERSDILFSPPI